MTTCMMTMDSPTGNTDWNIMSRIFAWGFGNALGWTWLASSTERRPGRCSEIPLDGLSRGETQMAGVNGRRKIIEVLKSLNSRPMAINFWQFQSWNLPEIYQNWCRFESVGRILRLEELQVCWGFVEVFESTACTNSYCEVSYPS